MERLTAYISGKVQKTGYRARVVDIARALGLKGTVENLADGRVKITAEGESDRLRWFEEAISIKNTLIQVSTVEKKYSEAGGDYANFYKMVGPGETDSRLDVAAVHLRDLIDAVNNMNNNLGGKMDRMIDGQEVLIKGQYVLIRGQEKLAEGQETLIKGQDVLIRGQEKLAEGQETLIKGQDVLIKGQEKLAEGQETLIEGQGKQGGKIDTVIDLQKDSLDQQRELLDEVKDSRKDLKGYLEQRFEKLESEVSEMKIALKARGII